MALIGMMPQTAFGTGTIEERPQPFQWGAGGTRMTPDDIAADRKRAYALQAAGMDTSPVGHWTQGLARVAQALVGTMQERRANKADAANQAHSDAVLQALMGGKDAGAAAAAAIADPYIGDDVKKLAFAQWERANPKPASNDTVADYNFMVQTLGRPAADRWLATRGDPIVNATLPNGQFISAPASMVPQFLGGAQTKPSTPSTMGTTLPDGWKIDEGGQTASPSGGFRP